MRVDIGIFAYNEGKLIGNVISALSKQSIFEHASYDCKVFILANGCTDDTVYASKQRIASLTNGRGSKFEVVEFVDGGKSKTWNKFVHGVAREEAELLVFMDADIGIENGSLLEKMANKIIENPSLKIFNSRPLKKINDDISNGLIGRLILASGGTATNYKTSICGQLYIARSRPIREIYMPVGLPVEDGFLRAMLLTDLLTASENLAVIDGDEMLCHYYESISSLSSLIHHQTRIIIGSAINALIFADVRKTVSNLDQRKKYLQSIAKEEVWLERLIKDELPTIKYGYIPFHFITKRLVNIVNKNKLSPKNILVAFIGLVFDSLIYINASYKMFLGKGAGHW